MASFTKPMRFLAAIVIVTVSGGCDRAQEQALSSPNTVTPSIKKFSTPDFNVRLPAGWAAVSDGTRPGLFIYQSSEGDSRLTISVVIDTALSADSRTDLMEISAIRRDAEVSQAGSLRLSEMEIATSISEWSSRWYGTDESAARRTATLVQFSKSKLFMVYLECLDGTEADAKHLATEVIASFEAK